MKRFGFIPYEDPYGIYGNMPEIPDDDTDGPHNTIDNNPAFLGCLYGFTSIFFVGIVLLVLFVISSLFSCSPRVIENTIVKHDTTFVQKLQRDSIYVKDSVFVHMWHDGDTVYVERDRWHTAWRDRIVKDTAYVSRTDTIYRADVKMVGKPLTSWQSFQLWLGRLALLAIVLTLAVVIIRKKFFSH